MERFLLHDGPKTVPGIVFQTSKTVPGTFFLWGKRFLTPFFGRVGQAAIIGPPAAKSFRHRRRFEPQENIANAEQDGSRDARRATSRANEGQTAAQDRTRSRRCLTGVGGRGRRVVAVAGVLGARSGSYSAGGSDLRGREGMRRMPCAGIWCMERLTARARDAEGDRRDRARRLQ